MTDTYHRVYSRIWDEPWHEDTRTLALYVLTCKHKRMEGLYRLPLEYVTGDLGWPMGKVRKHLSILESNGTLRYDHKAKVVWIVKALKIQAPNENQAKYAAKALRALPPTSLFEAFAEACAAQAPTLTRILSEEFPEAFGNHSAKGA